MKAGVHVNLTGSSTISVRVFGWVPGLAVAERPCDGSRGLQPTGWVSVGGVAERRLKASSNWAVHSDVAPRRKDSAAPIRGLKPTATFGASLREAGERFLRPTENIEDQLMAPRGRSICGSARCTSDTS